MSTAAAVVWLDHEKAKIFKFTTDGTKSEHSHQHHHPHTGDHNKHENDKYYEDLSKHLNNIPEILICGPGTAKNQFQHFLTSHHEQVAKNIVGVESIDHPSDNQLIAHARQFFKKFDAFH